MVIIMPNSPDLETVDPEASASIDGTNPPIIYSGTETADMASFHAQKKIFYNFNNNMKALLIILFNSLSSTTATRVEKPALKIISPH